MLGIRNSTESPIKPDFFGLQIFAGSLVSRPLVKGNEDPEYEDSGVGGGGGGIAVKTTCKQTIEFTRNISRITHLHFTNLETLHSDAL